MAHNVLGVIGGSGFYQMKGLEKVEQLTLQTPFGEPSDPFYQGRIGDLEVVFLARHGRGHRLLPSEINFRANVFGMKQLGVTHLVSISTAGSLKEEIHPGELIVPDQFIDRTFRRPQTFFGDGLVVHVSLASPVCADLARSLVGATRAGGALVHEGGTYLCMEGPQFSTRAESNLYRRFGASVISMTAMQEARLAREAEMCYAALVLVTDYDCWHESVAAVDIAEILRVMNANVEKAQKAVSQLAGTLGNRPRSCGCEHALKGTIITDRTVISQERIDALRPLLGKYL
ncbi:MAG: S-methyl-5'-thioadenosine phosphorylase [Candidatus Binatus sp.]|uniref:S-methyl-5'-thioadenosine phosphorylase n=1 Tax=Candidatus Binatus sp. TaxID=2811406 RepID=UPI002716465A|nr:S-methyl-5'-thioadenosine phosphorylase [Candidatus Binatus sp.]MDO8431037.1 S-methyl-5'-thioadenosine phosphorylase [Candidatus Binatus sp.]